MERHEAATMWGLLSPGIQSCLTTAVPTKNADESVHLACHGAVFEFQQKGGSGWLLADVPSTR